VLHKNNKTENLTDLSVCYNTWNLFIIASEVTT